MRGTGQRVRRLRTAAAGALVAVCAASGVLAGSGPAAADAYTLPATMSTTTQNTSTFSVPVPAGTTPTAITAVMTQPEVVEGGQVVFTVNGRLGLAIPSALYRKVSIPVTAADVIADGTISLSVYTQGTAAAGATCFPPAGSANLRKLALEYTGVETAPTAIGSFFPAVSTGVSVQIPSDADSAMITAGLTAIAALAVRYDDDTPLALVTSTPELTAVPATARLVVLTPGRAGEVPTEVGSTTVGTTALGTPATIPTLTITGEGDDLVNAARSLSSSSLGLSGSSAENPSVQSKPRSQETTRTFDSLGVERLALSGYGSVSQQVELRQDSFGQPVDAMKVHLEGTHTAFSDDGGARLDVRANGSLVGSATLGSESTFVVDFTVPASKLRSVNDLTLTLNALAPDGSACTPASVPAAEVDVDTDASTVEVSPGTGQVQGFQLFPQVLEGTLPIALKPSGGGTPATTAINAAALVAALQRAAGAPLAVQLMEPDAFLADDRSGMIVGAVNSDSVTLDAPLELSGTRQLDTPDSTFEETSDQQYAALEAIDRNDRLVLMLGSWAPGNKAASGALARKVVDYVTAQGWDTLDGDLVLADDATPAFATASDSLAPHTETVEEKSYAKWFIAVIAVLLLLLALQVVVAIRRDRQVARDDEGEGLDGPAYVEDDEDEPEVDDLGDVDDLDVLEGTEGRAQPPVRGDAADDDLDDDLDDDDLDGLDDELEDDELEDLEDEPEPEPTQEPTPPAKPTRPTRPAKAPVKKKR